MRRNTTENVSTTDVTPLNTNSHEIFRAQHRRYVICLVLALALAFTLEFMTRVVPSEGLFQNAVVKCMGLGAVLIFGTTAVMSVWMVRGASRAKGSVLLGVSALVAMEALALTGTIETWATKAVIGGQGVWHAGTQDLLFVGGLGMLLAGFYFLVFELIVEKHRAEVDRQQLEAEIEERNQIEAALRDSKERYSRIFENTEEGIVLLSENMKIIQFNPRFAEMLGYTPGDLSRIDPLSLIHAQDRHRFSEHHRQLIAGERVERSYEFRIFDRKGRQLYISGSFDLIQSTPGLLCVHGILRDISQRIHSQEAQLYRLQLESIISTASTNFMNSPTEEIDGNIEAVLRMVGEFISADRAYVIQLTDTFGEVMGTHEWSAPDIGPLLRKFTRLQIEDWPDFTKAMQARRAYYVPSVAQMTEELISERKRLEVGAVKTLCAVPMTFQDSLVGVLAVNYVRHEVEVSADTMALLKTIGEIFAGALVRRSTEAALRKSEAKYRSILENMVEGYYEADLAGRFMFFNDSLSKILGYSREELLGKGYKELYSEETATFMFDTFHNLYKSGQPVDIRQWEVKRKDGTTAYVEASGSLIEGEDGKPIGFSGIMRDVTERHIAEEERQQLQVKMQHAQKLESLGILAGGIAHDFNNLLMGVMANASIALDELSADSPVRPSLEHIELSAQRAADLANQMLTYSGKAKFIIKPLDLSILVEEMAHLLEVSTSKRAKLLYNFSRNLPPIEGDPTQLRQVVMNLITNASEAMDGKKGIIDISTSVVEAGSEFFDESYLHFDVSPGKYVCLKVTDEGCGMDAATKERIFDPFFTSKFTGRGLGLASVIGIVRGHKGAIKVDSEFGVGTTFTVLFPASAKAALPIRAPEPAATEDLQGDGTVLVIDDEVLILDVARRILERAGYTVLTAADGFEGLELFKANIGSITLVLMDMTMPRMNGVEAFQEMGRIDPAVPVVLSSGFNESEARSYFKGRKPAGFIQKPYRGAELLVKLHDMLKEVTVS